MGANAGIMATIKTLLISRVNKIESRFCILVKEMGNGDTRGCSCSCSGFLAGLQPVMNMQSTVSSYHGSNMKNFMSPYYHHDQLHKHQDSTEIGGALLFGNEFGINNRVASGISLQPSSGHGAGLEETTHEDSSIMFPEITRKKKATGAT